MLVKNLEQKKEWIQKILNSNKIYKKESLVHVVDEILSKKSIIEHAVQNNRTPCYVLDHSALNNSIARYKSSFEKHLPASKHFYAVKVNHHPIILRRLFQEGFGADVSSARELEFALNEGASKIVFSGPGKSKVELAAAIQHRDKVTINIDSFGELQKLGTLTDDLKVTICAGVRVSFKTHGAWEKFGIPLNECRSFFEEAKKFKHINLIGIQFHISWNSDAQPYIYAIESLAEYLKNSFPPEFLTQLQFIDIGGGFRPYNAEGFFPDDTALGAIIQAAALELDLDPEFSIPYLITEAIEIEEYAKGIGKAIDAKLRPLLNCEYYTEPGRIISNNAMHVVLQIEDVKSESCIILNGGTNIVGFERFEFDYFPLVNLTHPSRNERPCMIYGSLCMPQDYWGQYIYASDLKEGDLIVVPYQGALTYANMQDFIKGRVDVYELTEK